MTTPRRAVRASSAIPGAVLAPAAPTITLVPLDEAGITPDPANAQRHNPRNLGVIEASMQIDGAGRSILVDQHGVTIAGAGAWEAATHAGITHAAVAFLQDDTRLIDLAGAFRSTSNTAAVYNTVTI